MNRLVNQRLALVVIGLKMFKHLPQIALCILAALAYFQIVHLIDRLLSRYYKKRMEREMVKLVLRHREAHEQYFKTAVQDEIEYMIDTMYGEIL